MKRLKIAIVALVAVVAGLLLVNAPAQATLGPFNVGQSIVKTSTGSTYTVTAVSINQTIAKTTGGCFKSSYASGSTGGYVIKGTTKAVYKLSSCPTGLYWK